MIHGKTLLSVLEKFISKSETGAHARVQVCLPNGELYDVVGIQ